MNALITTVHMACVTCVFFLAGCTLTIPCDAEVGVCPRPQVGVVVNNAGFVKSIWLDEPEVTVSGRGVVTTICRADVDAAPGEEVLFLGNDAFVVAAVDPSLPRIVSKVAAHLYDISMIDIEGDGNIEYVERGYSIGFRLRDHTGDVLWEFAPDSEAPMPFGWSNPVWLDSDGDRTLEFLIGTDHGVELRSADGSVLRTIGSAPYKRMYLGQFDVNADLELIAGLALPQEGLVRVDTFDLEGTLLGSFSLPDPDGDWLYSYFYVAADPTVPGLERIRGNCILYDPAGNDVGALEMQEYGSCFTRRDIVGEDQLSTNCSISQADEMGTEPFNVRFDVGGGAHRVELTYSLERYDWTDFNSAGTAYYPKRTILMIYDPNGYLVYHEVLDSKSGPGSFAVIPSEVEGAEVLLLADDSTVFAYSLPAVTP